MFSGELDAVYRVTDVHPALESAANDARSEMCVRQLPQADEFGRRNAQWAHLLPTA